MLTKLILYIKKNLRPVILGSFTVLLLVTFINLFLTATSNQGNLPPLANTPILSQDLTKVDLSKFSKKDVTTLNYRYLKHLAMDSLIDNKILTVENIAIIDSIYPDSLCHCADDYYFDSLLNVAR